MSSDVRASGVGLSILFALATFLGAALFMQLQPLVGRVLLPQLGGVPGVWITCLGFFQLTLLGGYGLVHVSARHWAVRAQALSFAALLAGVLLRGPLQLSEVSTLGSPDSPLSTLLGFLCAHVALTAVALSMTSPLLQSWYAAISGSDPYRLYAVSNAGSLLGLLSYPTIIEPWLGLQQTGRLWAQAFVVHALLMLGLAGLAALRNPARHVLHAPGRDATDTLSAREVARWLVLSAAPSALLAAITNHITLDVPSTPLLWVVPLALYLGSFVLAFGRPDGARAELYAALWIACTVALSILLLPGNEARLSIVLGVPLATLWVGCMLCHGKLVQLRPLPSQLTAYYVSSAAGGALGGGAVAFGAPQLLNDHYELVLALLAIHALQLGFSGRRDRKQPPTGHQRLAWLGFGLGVPVLLAVLWVQVTGTGRPGQLLERSRDFFGPLQVRDTRLVRVLTHGRTDQGQALRDPMLRAQPVGYVGPETAVARALRLHAVSRPRQLGVLGLGVGALAAYAQHGDHLRFYELNPAMQRFSRRWFLFLATSQATISIASGDGRLALTREAPHAFDVLVLDAFSSDAIPVHLLTTEAFAVYLRQLAPDGVMLVNVSNRHLRVESVVAASARAHGLQCVVLESAGDRARGLVRARWALLARRRQLLTPLLGAPAMEVPVPHPQLWTDDHASLLSIVR